MSYFDERPRGILTPSDRELLRDEIEYENRQQYSNRRQDIRQRIANGLLDFSTIQYLLRDRDRKRIFQEPAEEAGVVEAQFFESIRAMLYWTYLGLKEQNYDFEGLLNEAIEDAEMDYARKYLGESVEVDVRLEVDVKRSHDIDDVIAQVENGGPIQANRLYDLVQLSGGVPIDTSELDELRVWFQSSYPEGEKEVIESIFSDYLNVDVDIIDAIQRADIDKSSMSEGSEGGVYKESAVVKTDRSRPDPSQIKHYRDARDQTSDDADVSIRPSDRRNSSREGSDNSDIDESILNSAIDELVENSENMATDIDKIIRDQQNDGVTQEKRITPENVDQLLRHIRDPFVSTEEIAAVFDCATDAARQSLLTLFEEDEVERHRVQDTNGESLDIWWKPAQQE